MKKFKWVLLLLLLLIPVQVFAETSMEDAEDLLYTYGLSPSSVINDGSNYISVYENSKGYNDDFKMVNTLIFLFRNGATSGGSLCNALYDGNEMVTFGGLQAYNGNYVGICYEGCAVETYTYDTFNAAYNTLYGEDAPKKGVLGYGNYFALLDYVDNSDLYAIVDMAGGRGAYADTTRGFIYKITSVKENDDNLEIVVAYDNIVDNGEKLVVSSKEFDRDQDIEEIAEVMKTNYLDQVSHYKVTLNKKNDSYVFGSLRRMTDQEVQVPDAGAFVPLGLSILGTIFVITGSVLWIKTKKKEQQNVGQNI